MSTEHDYAAEERVRGAAQELLAALKDLADERWPEWPATAQMASLFRARAVIARAEGRE